MKKGLAGVLIGASMFFLSPKLQAQDVKYECYVHSFGKLRDIGDIYISNKEVNVSLNNVEDMNMRREGDFYFEKSKTGAKDETHEYFFNEGCWKVVKSIVNGERVNVGKEYGSEVILPMNFFEKFSEDKLPEKIEVVLMGNYYSFLRGEPVDIDLSKIDTAYRGQGIQVKYYSIGDQGYEGNVRKLDSPIKFTLEKQTRGHSVLQAEAIIEWKRWFGSLHLDTVVKKAK